jgi:hypothetical protein
MSQRQAAGKLTIGRFWQMYPKTFRMKQGAEGIVEFVFLAVSIRKKLDDQDKVCAEHPDSGEQLKLAQRMTIFLHVVHVARLIHEFFTSYVKKRTMIGGVIKCLLMDCYCSCAGFIYIYVQICYYINWKKCVDPGLYGNLTAMNRIEG